MDLRTEKTERSILNAFIGLRAQKPLEKITVKELCQAAGINRGTFYAHYTDLYDLLRAVRLRHPRLTAPLDLLYCQAVGLAVFLFVLRQSDGQLRGFILLGGLGGGVLFFSLLSRPLRPVWDFWMDRWMELFQFLSLPGRFCAAVYKKFAFQAKTLFYFLRKYATIHIEGVWKPLRKGGMSHGKAHQTRKKEKIR